MMGGGGNTSTTFYIITEEKANTKKMEAEIPQVLADLPVDAAVSTSNMDLSVLGGSGVAMTLYGDDLDELQTVSYTHLDVYKRQVLDLGDY